MSQFVVTHDGGVYEASVRDTLTKLKELFPEIDPTSLEANLMLERSHPLLAGERESHWARCASSDSAGSMLLSRH